MITRIAALGDSTSCGEGVGLRLPPDQTWPARLSEAAHAELLPLARPGARLEDVWQDQLPGALASGADVVTLLIGLNDLSQAGFDGHRFAERLSALVLALRDTGALVLLGRLHDAGSVLPMPPGLRETVRTRTAAVNAAVDACAGPEVRLVDLSAVAALRSRRAWDVDRVHPNSAGHALIAAAAAQVLREAGCRVGPVRPPRLPAPPSPWREAQWLVRHGLPWLGAHVPQVVVPALSAAVRVGRRG